MSSVQEKNVAEAPDLQEGGNDQAIVQAFINGQIGKELGLAGSDLRIGLTVAKNLLTRGAHVEALRVYMALVLCEPMNVDFQVGLANCASVIGEHHVALHAASAVIMLAPSDPRGYLLSGRSCFAIGNLHEAKQDLEDALGLAIGQSQRVVEREATLLLGRLAIPQE